MLIKSYCTQMLSAIREEKARYQEKLVLLNRKNALRERKVEIQEYKRQLAEQERALRREGLQIAMDSKMLNNNRIISLNEIVQTIHKDEENDPNVGSFINTDV